MFYIGKRLVTPNKIVHTGEVNNQDKNITENGTYTADEGYTGLGTVVVNVEGGATISAKNLTGSTINNGDKIWIEIVEESDGNISYNIIPSKFVNEDSIPGVAKEEISVNNSGSITVLPSGNGTYAPTTTTKTVTENGVYAAVADGAYGYSVFEVDIQPPIPDVTAMLIEINSGSGSVHVE